MHFTRHREPVLFWVLAVFLAFTSITGGSSRADVPALPLLWLTAILVTARAMWTVKYGDLKRHYFLFTILISVIILTIIHLLPLPPAVWTKLPGRELVTKIDSQAGLGTVFRPISLTPRETWNAFYSIFVFMAVILPGVQMRRSSFAGILPVVICIGLVSGILGICQIISPRDSPLFFYEHTNYGAATGLFANRNHQAIFLAMLFPMLAAFVTVRASGPHPIRDAVGAAGAGLLVIPLILVTGSRAGLLIGGLSLLSVPFLLRTPTPIRTSAHHVSRRLLTIGAAVLIVGLVVVTISMSRAASVNRLLQASVGEDQRFIVWPVIARMAWTYFPVGSGIGSFAQVFQIGEPMQSIGPTWLNHAHNEVLEVLLTAGLPGIALLVAAFAGWAVAAVRAFLSPLKLGDNQVLFERLGVIISAIIGIGSVADYPLRTPFLMATLGLAALWCGGRDRGSAKQPGASANS